MVVPEGSRLEKTVAAAAKGTGIPADAAHRDAVARRLAGAPGLRRGQPRGLPLPGDLRVRSPGVDRRRSSCRDGRAASTRPPTDADLEASRRGARPHAATRCSPSRASCRRGGARGLRQGRPRHLQPAQGGHAAAARLDGQLRPRQPARSAPDRRAAHGRLARTTPTATRACRPARSTRPGEAAIAGRARPGRRAPGSTSSRPTWRPRRPSSPRPTPTSSSSSRSSRRMPADDGRTGGRPRPPDRALALAGAAPRGLRRARPALDLRARST